MKGWQSMSLKSVTVNCLVGGITFLVGVMIGCISAGSEPLALLGLMGSSAVAIYAAISTATADGKWLDEHAADSEDADTATATADDDPYNAGYDAGYAAGFDDAAESLQFTHPPRELKPRYRGA